MALTAVVTPGAPFADTNEISIPSALVRRVRLVTVLIAVGTVAVIGIVAGTRIVGARIVGAVLLIRACDPGGRLHQRGRKLAARTCGGDTRGIPGTDDQSELQRGVTAGCGDIVAGSEATYRADRYATDEGALISVGDPDQVDDIAGTQSFRGVVPGRERDPERHLAVAEEAVGRDHRGVKELRLGDRGRGIVAVDESLVGLWHQRRALG